MKAVSIPDPVSVQERDDDAITAKLNEVYAAEDSALDPVLQSIQTRSVKKDKDNW